MDSAQICSDSQTLLRQVQASFSLLRLGLILVCICLNRTRWTVLFLSDIFVSSNKMLHPAGIDLA
jgi:hypothetical protein